MGVLSVVKMDLASNDEIVVVKSAGTVDYTKGEITMSNFTILKGSFSDNRIELRVKPANKDIEVKREMYLDVDISNSKFVAHKED